MRMKRAFAFLMALMMCLSVLFVFSACGKNRGSLLDDEEEEEDGNGKEDLSIVFKSQTFEYDGTPKSIYIEDEDELPRSISVTYEGNGQILPGTYTVTARFSGSSSKYNIPRTKTAKLTIVYNEASGLPNPGTNPGGTSDPSNPSTPGGATDPSNTDEYGRPRDDLDAKNLNYQGATVNVLYWSDVEDPEFDVDRITGDNVLDAIFDRNSEIERRLNVTLKFDSTPGNVNNRARFVQKVQNVTDAGTRDYDQIATYSRTAGALATQGYLYNLNDIQDSHINFSKPWWPARLVESLSLGGDLYMVSGDMSTNVLHQMHVIYFNKEIFSLKYNTLATSRGFTGDSDEGISPACQMLYEYAYNKSEMHPYGGKWTNQMLIDLSSNQYKDLNGNGKDENDQYGFCTTSYHIDAFYTGANLRLVEQVDDARLLTISPDYGSAKTGRLVNQLGQWLTTSSCFVQKGDGLPFTKPFAKGNALFITARAHYAEQELLDVDFIYGMLPTPRYDEQQVNYYTCLGNAFSIYGIYRYFGDKYAWGMNQQETLSMLTAVLECWASESYRLATPEIFEVNMQLKYADTQYETDMFEYVRGTVTFDLGRIFTNDLSYMSELPSHAACNGAEWSSAYGQYRESLDEKLAQLVESFAFD